MTPGVHQLSMRDYLAAPGLSRSGVKRFLKSPAHFRYAQDHPEGETDDTILGSMLHSALLEPNVPTDPVYIKPDTYKNEKGETKPWSGNAAVCRAWLKEHADKPAISADKHKKMQVATLGMLHRIRNHAAASIAVREGIAEQSLFWNDAETGVLLKARADWLSGNAIVDPKTTGDASRSSFEKSIITYGYDIQGALLVDGCAALGLPQHFFILIAVEKEPPYACAVYQLDDESIELGRRKYRGMLSTYKFCQETNIWPAYEEDIQIISVPAWALREQREYGSGLMKNGGWASAA